MFKDAGFRQRDIQKLGDDKLFIGPKHNIYAFSWFYLVYLIWYYYLCVKFAMWIVKQKIENKQNLCF